MALSPGLTQDLLKSNPSYSTSSSAIGGTAEVGGGQKIDTGTFNFGGSSLTPILLIGAGVAAFFFFMKYR